MYVGRPCSRGRAGRSRETRFRAAAAAAYLICHGCAAVYGSIWTEGMRAAARTQLLRESLVRARALTVYLRRELSTLGESVGVVVACLLGEEGGEGGRGVYIVRPPSPIRRLLLVDVYRRRCVVCGGISVHSHCCGVPGRELLGGGGGLIVILAYSSTFAALSPPPRFSFHL